MVSNPEAMQALYSERRHALPPGRELSLEPIVGARSVLLLEGAEHLSRRKLMLPPFHGNRMRAYEPIVRDVGRARDRPLARRASRSPRTRSMQAITLEVILSAVFGVTDPAPRPPAHAARRPAGSHRLARPAVRGALVARFGGPDPLARIQALTGEIDARPADRDRRAPRRPRTAARRHLLAADRRPLRGRRADGRPRAARPAHDAAARRARDDRHRARLDARPAARHPPVLARLAPRSTPRRLPARGLSESLRLRPVVPLAGRRLASELRVDGLRCRRVRMSRPRSG